MPGPANLRPSVIRHALMWWFKEPASPSMSVNFAVDFSQARRWLDGLAADGRPRPTVQHLVVAAVARTLAAFPQANARIVGGRIQAVEHVGVAMPVDLLGNGSVGRELSATVLERAEERTLWEVTEATRRQVKAERMGDVQNAVVRTLLKLGERLPPEATWALLDALERARINPGLAKAFTDRLPITTGVTNPGSTYGLPQGVLFRAGSFIVPQRFVFVGTVWGISAIQDEVVAVDGQPAVRPMLPVLLIFDHRLFDGVVASRIVMHMAGMLLDPAATFGPDGNG